METSQRTMQAAAIDRFGGPEVISIHTLPVPVPGANEVLIALHTAGVASWDADNEIKDSAITLRGPGFRWTVMIQK